MRAAAGTEALYDDIGGREAPEAVVGVLATASLGAVWTSCSPEYGVDAIAGRLAQPAPRVLLVADGHLYGGRRFPASAATAAP